MNKRLILIAALGFFGGLAPALNAAEPNDASGTIATGGVSQQILAAQSVGRTFLLIQNREATDHLYVNFGAAAASTGQSSIDLSPGASLFMDVFIPRDTVNIIGPNTGDKFLCKWF
jgi:hypothetical protein